MSPYEARHLRLTTAQLTWLRPKVETSTSQEEEEEEELLEPPVALLLTLFIDVITLFPDNIPLVPISRDRLTSRCDVCLS